MEYRRMGKTGLQLSSLSLGSWLTFGKQISDDVAENLMHLAYDQGVNFFDNAEIYARGRSEEVMGTILKRAGWDRTSYVVSSKVYFGDGRKLPNQTGLSRKHLFEGCHDSLRRLQLDYMDLYFCHRPDKQTPIEETVWSMNLLIQQGKILYWGTSEWSAQEIMEAHLAAKENHLLGPVMEQPQYNMFHRQKMEVEFLQIFRNLGMGTTIWSPLASGMLTDKYAGKFPEGTRMSLEGLEWLKDSAYSEEKVAKIQALSKLAAELGISLAKLAIAWCLKNPHVTTVILGASRLEQLQETLTSAECVEKITPDVESRIEAILQNKPEQPPY